jgi:hypothetical protein
LDRLFERNQAHRSLPSFLSAAARRYFSVLVFSETPIALSFLFGAATLLLLAGTLLINAHWLWVGAFIGLVFASMRVRRRWLTRYRLAQVLDNRLRLNDSLSTAWYLLTQNTARDNPTAERQIAGAEGLAAGIEPHQAFPIEWTSIWSIPGVLVLVMLALFTLRYGRSERFDLRPSLLPLPVQRLLLPQHNEANEIRRDAWKSNPQRPQGSMPPDQSGAPIGEHTNELSAGKTMDGTGGVNSAGASDSGEKALDDLQQAQQLASEQQRNSSSSLLDRMQNALGGVMAKLHQALKPGDSRAQKNSQNGEPSPNEEKNSQAGEANAKSPSQQADSSQTQRGDTNGQPTAAQPQAIEKTNSAAQLGNAKQPANESGDNSQSGAGRNDGRKDLHEAEQLKALGKLEEIIGKRSASVTGDMTIEKSSGKQQLRTEYSNEVARHSDLGGEVNRDEIPAEYRAYIRAYMDAIHKQAPPAPR